jgi:tyrosyl-tRNA synthetase
MNRLRWQQQVHVVVVLLLLLEEGKGGKDQEGQEASVICYWLVERMLSPLEWVTKWMPTEPCAIKDAVARVF